MFDDADNRADVYTKMDAFLVSLGYLDERG